MRPVKRHGVKSIYHLSPWYRGLLTSNKPAVPPPTLHGVPDRRLRLASTTLAVGSSKGTVHTLIPKLKLLLSLESQELQARWA